jgi:putative ABC transport system permease protein
VREAVLALPNIADAGVSYLTPIGAGGFTPAVQIAGMPTTEAPSVEVFGNLISPGWLDTFGMSLLAGRDFTNRDRRGAPGVVLVNEAFAKAFLGGANPLGRSIVVYAGTPRQLSPIEIVGLVKDSVYGSARSTPPPAWYAPFDQFDIPLMQPMFSSARLSVRATTAPAALTRSLTSAITALDPRLALTFQPLATAVNGTIAQDRLLARLATAFGVLALVLAAVGLYGVTAYSVSRRRTEIGIRVAMGARPARVMQLVLARLTVLIACGIVAGVGLSMWLGTFVTTLLYKLEPRDPATLAAAALILCATAAFAGLLPAWRASRREPIVELRR